MTVTQHSTGPNPSKIPRLRRKATPARTTGCIAAVATLLAATVWSTPPARAGIIPTFDIANITQAIATTGQISNQVAAIGNTIKQVEKVLNVQNLISSALGAGGSGIGDIGGMSIGHLISDASMGLNLAMSAAGKAEQMYSLITDLTKNPMSVNHVLGNLQGVYELSRGISASANAATALANQAMADMYAGKDTMAQSQTVIQTNLYSPVAQPTAAQQQAVLMQRQSAAETASIGAILAASTTLNSLDNNNASTLSSLASGITASLDERGDVKANSAVQMKILEQIIVENQLLSWLLRVEASRNTNEQPIALPTQTQ